MPDRDANPARQDNPSVSIAMATYNGTAFLKDQLASLAAQTRLPAELVITDDCSTDTTLELARDFARAAPFAVRVHQNPARLGYRANFMRAMSLCSGDLIAFCDQDDVWRPHKLATVVPCFDDPDVLLVHHNADMIDAHGAAIGLLRQDAPQPPVAEPLSLGPWFVIPGFTQVFRRAIADMGAAWPTSIDFYTESQPMAHDQWSVFLCSVLGRIVYLDARLVQYRIHASNTEGWSTRPVGIVERMRYRVENRTQVYDRLRRSSLHHVDTLVRLPSDIPESWQERASAGAARWQALADSYETRQRIYDSPGPIARARALARLIRKDGYNGKGFWTFGGKGLLKDAVLGAALGPLTRRYGFAAVGGDPTCMRGARP
ncbi:MAG: glycosyltransferase [Acetobacteraceae bacterium]|nr:glycosyltransferase [Acetobacteraceae bacterium]